MVKKLLLQNRTNTALKNRPVVRKSTSYNAVKSIGILINLNDLEDISIIERLKNELSVNGSDVSIMTFVHDTKKLPDYFILKGIGHFSNKDVSVTGSILSARLQQFVEKEFDYMYVINSTEDPYIDFVSAVSKAKFRMGVYQKNRKDMYELNIELEKYSTDLLISQLRTYSKIIS